jgi:hypothetical protein
MNSLLPVYRPARDVLQFGYAEVERAIPAKGLRILWIETGGEAGLP